jgi:hypothetical protein
VIAPGVAFQVAFQFAFQVAPQLASQVASHILGHLFWVYSGGMGSSWGYQQFCVQSTSLLIAWDPRSCENGDMARLSTGPELLTFF